MKYKNYENVYEMDHPLIKHKISLLRDKNTGTQEFRKLVEEIAALEGFVALRDLPLKDVEISSANSYLQEKGIMDSKEFALYLK